MSPVYSGLFKYGGLSLIACCVECVYAVIEPYKGCLFPAGSMKDMPTSRQTVAFISGMTSHTSELCSIGPRSQHIISDKPPHFTWPRE